MKKIIPLILILTILLSTVAFASYGCPGSTSGDHSYTITQKTYDLDGNIISITYTCRYCGYSYTVSN